MVENRDFSYPLGGGSPSEYFYNVWQGKTRIVDLPDGGKV